MENFSHAPPNLLGPSDKSSILKHLLALGPDDRYGRFAATLGDTAIASYVDRIDFARDLGFGLWDSADELSGFIHLTLYHHKAELAASVRLAARYQGKARRLFQAALTAGEMLGVRRVHLATGHPAALRIAHSLAYRVQTSSTMPRASILLPALEMRMEHLLCG